MKYAWVWCGGLFVVLLFHLTESERVHQKSCYKLKDKEGRAKKLEKFKEECNVAIREVIQKEEKNEQEDAASRKKRLTNDFKLCVMRKNKVVKEDNTTNIATMIDFIDENGVPEFKDAMKINVYTCQNETVIFNFMNGRSKLDKQLPCRLPGVKASAGNSRKTNEAANKRSQQAISVTINNRQ